jgi:hypothetical protein
MATLGGDFAAGFYDSLYGKIHESSDPRCWAAELPVK